MFCRDAVIGILLRLYELILSKPGYLDKRRRHRDTPMQTLWSVALGDLAPGRAHRRPLNMMRGGALSLTAPPACLLRWTHPNASIQLLGSLAPLHREPCRYRCLRACLRLFIGCFPCCDGIQWLAFCIDPYELALESHPTSSNACAISSVPIGITSFGRRLLL